MSKDQVSVACEKCFLTAHRDCAGLTDDEYAVGFTCGACLNVTVRKHEKSDTQMGSDGKQKELEKSSLSQEDYDSYKSAALEVISLKDSEITRLREELNHLRAREAEIKPESSREVPIGFKRDLEQLKAHGKVVQQESEDESVVNSDDEEAESAAKAFNTLAVSLNRQYLGKLPKFSGDERDWAFFEAAYNDTTKQGKFSESENVVRLRECLQSPALGTVQHLISHGTDAKQAMKTLRSLYGKPERLVARLLQEWLNFPSLENGSDDDLRAFAIKGQNFVANLKTLRREKDLDNVLAMEILKQKLQPGIFREWVKKSREGFALFRNQLGKILSLSLIEHIVNLYISLSQFIS